MTARGDDRRPRVIPGSGATYLEGGEPAATVAEGRMLLLLHAFPLGCPMWAAQLDAFPGWRVIAPSFPGFDGAPPASPETESMDGYARHVLGVAQALGVTRAVVGGLSMGGYAAFALLRQAAVHAPGFVRGLVLADTRAAADSEAAWAGRQRTIRAVSREGVTAVSRDLTPKALGETTQRERPALAEMVEGLMLAQPAWAVSAALRVLASRPDSTPMLERIQVPTLVVVGDEDVMTPPDEAHAMAQAIPGARFELIAKAGHLSSLEQPEGFTAVVRGFLDSL